MSKPLANAMNRLRLLIANEGLATRVLNHGFKTLNEAIEYACWIQDKRRDYERFAGPLMNNTYLFLNMKQMVRREEKVILTYDQLPGNSKAEKRTSLGQARALAQLAALAYGYVMPELQGDQGRFNIYRGHGSDDHGTRYEATARKMDHAFWHLDLNDQKELLDLAKRRQKH